MQRWFDRSMWKPLAAGLLAGVANAALAAWLASSLAWPALAIGFALGALVAAGSAAGVLAGWWRERRLAQSYLQTLERLDRGQLTADSLADELPNLPDDHAWHAALSRLRDAQIERSQRLARLEHQQAALDIRWRRAAAQHQRTREVLAVLPPPLVVVNEYDELVAVNAAARRLFGLPELDEEAKLSADALNCPTLSGLLGDVRRRRLTAPRHVDVQLETHDGESPWYRASAVSLAATAEGGESCGAWGALAVLVDIGEQKVMQTRHAEFVSSVSHEMKTPLASIKAYVELLADNEADDEETREEFLSVINSQADRLQRLIDNLLNLARIEAGVAKVNKRNQSLNELLEEAVSVMQPAAERKQIELRADISQMYIAVLADRDMLLQAAINLLSNAIKYTPERGTVTLRSRMSDCEAWFEVEDSGVGLSEEDCARVFERFYRVRKDSEMAPGTGLGLSLVKYIVEDVHGGEISVQSQLGVGSTFRVKLASARQIDGPREGQPLTAGIR